MFDPSQLNTPGARRRVRMNLEADLEKANLQNKAKLEGAIRRRQPQTRGRVGVVLLGPFHRVRTGQRLAKAER